MSETWKPTFHERARKIQKAFRDHGHDVFGVAMDAETAAVHVFARDDAAKWAVVRQERDGEPWFGLGFSVQDWALEYATDRVRLVDRHTGDAARVVMYGRHTLEPWPYHGQETEGQ
jgi:hypothetical protein